MSKSHTRVQASYRALGGVALLVDQVLAGAAQRQRVHGRHVVDVKGQKRYPCATCVQLSIELLLDVHLLRQLTVMDTTAAVVG